MGRTGSVVHVVPALFSDDDGIIGGAERYVFELARHMAHCTPTSLVSFGQRHREEQIGPLRIKVLGDSTYVRGQRFNPIAFGLLKELRQADVVHCHQQHIVASSLAALVGRLIGRPVFCTDLGGGGWDISAYVSTDRWFRGHLHISRYSQRIAGHNGQPWAHVIWGGVDTDKFSAATSTTREGGVLFVGRILPHKGIDFMIKSLPETTRATVIGPIGNARYLQDLHALANGKRVTFRHDCSDEGVIDAYRQADCVVLPSVYDDMYGGHSAVPELLGQTLLEGMACEAPGICTNVASLPEIVDDGETGYVVAPNDGELLRRRLTDLTAHQAHARAMGRAARASVLRRFTWKSVVERCLSVYGLTPSSTANDDPPVTS